MISRSGCGLPGLAVPAGLDPQGLPLGLQVIGKPFDEDADARMRASVEDQIERESLALFMTGKIYDDGIIDPRDTRTVLGIGLSVVDNAEVRGRHGDGFGVSVNPEFLREGTAIKDFRQPPLTLVGHNHAADAATTIGRSPSTSARYGSQFRLPQ